MDIGGVFFAIRGCFGRQCPFGGCDLWTSRCVCVFTEESAHGHQGVFLDMRGVYFDIRGVLRLLDVQLVGRLQALMSIGAGCFLDIGGAF